ncbi:unnamed protein product [Urochloa decumbens]|uniref:Gnk2-homologous domain-containing protein n=1 Tax=Urochloa decumbens TaxID=240449 RepID=A0ABC8XE72_9POAL
MASPKLSGGGLPSLIVVVLVLLLLQQPGIALKLEPADTSSHFPPLLDCAPAAPSNVLGLLGALPSIAAAAPTGFAATNLGAFARGSCFGLGAPGGPYHSDCLECLSAAAGDVASGCGAATRRAGCFLSYADTNASTAREDAVHGWFYDDSDGGGAPTVTLGSQQCTADRTAAQCSQCLDDSARVVRALMAGNQLSRVHGDAVVVVGYGCYLRVPLFAPEPRWAKYLLGAIDVLDVVLVVLLEVGGVLFCISEAREFNQA